MIVLFTLHNHDHVNIAKLMNQAIKINKIINKFTGYATVLNKRVKRIIEIKFISVLFQIMASLLTSFSQTLIGWACFSYPQMLTMLTSAIFIFGVMLLSLNSLICINSKLETIVKNNHHNDEKSAYVSLRENDIDEVSVLFNKINEFTIQHNGLYGVHLTLTLVGSVALLLCSVKF